MFYTYNDDNRLIRDRLSFLLLAGTVSSSNGGGTCNLVAPSAAVVSMVESCISQT